MRIKIFRQQFIRDMDCILSFSQGGIEQAAPAIGKSRTHSIIIRFFKTSSAFCKFITTHQEFDSASASTVLLQDLLSVIWRNRSRLCHIALFFHSNRRALHKYSSRRIIEADGFDHGTDRIGKITFTGITDAKEDNRTSSMY
jgi:hypothetical protein